MARLPKILTAEQAWAAWELVAESIPHIVRLSHPSGSTDYFNTLSLTASRRAGTASARPSA